MLVPTFITTLRLNEEVKSGRIVNLTDYDLYPEDVKEVMRYFAKKKGINEEDMKSILSTYADDLDFSITGADAIESMMHRCIEEYNVLQDEQVLLANNIVDAYNAINEGHFDAAYKVIKDLSYATQRREGDLIYLLKRRKRVRALEEKIVGGYNPVLATINEINAITVNLGNIVGAGDGSGFVFKEKVLKEWVIQAAYRPSNNPQEVKKILEARIAYNDTMVHMFTDMVTLNHSMLDISKDQASMLAEKLKSKDQGDRKEAFKTIKKQILKNKKKFRTKFGYDLRPLGAGCVFLTLRDMGRVKKFISIDRLVQLALEYDAVVVGHGMSTVAHKGQEVTTSAWTIQPIITQKSDGPIQGVDRLVHQLYKEGFRNIYLNSCNPAGKEPSASVKKLKGLNITYSKTSLIAESVDELDRNDPLYGAEASLVRAENHMMDICESVGILYGDDEYLQECADRVKDIEAENLNEGLGSDLWGKVQDGAKTAIGAVVNMFKNLIKHIRTSIEDIRYSMDDLIKRSNSAIFTRPVRSTTIIIEAASVVTNRTTDFSQLKLDAVVACERIADRVEILQRHQLDNLKEIKDAVDRFEHELVENSIPDMDDIVRSMFTRTVD